MATSTALLGAPLLAAPLLAAEPQAQAAGLGKVLFPTSAQSEKVQAHFLRGVAALHMPSHIFLQLGMWPEAAA
jgi:hypothetical protein